MFMVLQFGRRAKMLLFVIYKIVVIASGIFIVDQIQRAHKRNGYMEAWTQRSNVRWTGVYRTTRCSGWRWWFVYYNIPYINNNNAGIIISVVMDGNPNGKAFLLVLDAKTMKEIARANTPNHIPFGCHAKYVGTH
jgi:hypothetical protein